jgi:hypothetical protein
MRRAAENQRIVIAGASYAGLHVALRLATKLRDNPGVELTLVDRPDHQTLTELAPRSERARTPPTRCASRRSGSCASGSDSPRPRSSASTWPLGRGGNTDSVFKITANALQSVLPTPAVSSSQIWTIGRSSNRTNRPTSAGFRPPCSHPALSYLSLVRRSVGRDRAYLVGGRGGGVVRRSSRPPRPIGSGSRMGRRRCSKTIEVRTSATSGRPVSRSMTKA